MGAPSETNEQRNLFGGDVQIEAHGVPGTTGRFFGAQPGPLTIELSDEAMWLERLPLTDTHVAFRADLDLAVPADFVLQVQAASTFRLWIDGATTVSGPLRYAAAVPEIHQQPLRLGAGRHRFAVHAVADGITNRMSPALPGFLWCRLLDAGGEQQMLQWRARQLIEYAATGLRISPLLGWMEWLNIPLLGSWTTAAVDSTWSEVSAVPALRGVLGRAVPSITPLPAWPEYRPAEVGHGRYRDTYTGYRWDDPAMQFVLADDNPDPTTDLDGTWVRYDLDRVRIGSLEVTVETEQPAEVTIAYCERRGPDGRPVPVVPLSAGSTRMIQHYAVGAGTTRIQPLQAIGGRWLEVRVATTGQATLRDPVFRERDFLGPARGTVDLDDPQLNRIWSVGIDTLRSSAEDAIVDSVRERGEWIGDVVSSAMEILSVGWGDMRLVRRALFHAAAGARDDGLVAGCGPGELLYLGTYAAQWVAACLRCAELEGDPAVLTELEVAAERNVTAILALIDEDGRNTLPWSFVDWGYKSPEGRVDIAVLCHVVRALDAWIRWQKLLHGESADLRRWHHERRRVAAAAARALSERPTEIGYHEATLGALVGLVDPEIAAPVIRRQLLAGFPFDPAGSRLRDCTVAKVDSVTPYFTNYAMRVLFETGQADLVRDLWRRGWGWMLDNGATTWWEVFDDRWSRSHYWSGAPTWQAARYFLGLDPKLDRTGARLSLGIYPGSLRRASGVVPLGTTGTARVSWVRDDDELVYDLQTDVVTVVEADGERMTLDAGDHRFTLHPRGAMYR